MPGRKCRPHGRIDGIAAIGQDERAGLARLRVGTDHRLAGEARGRAGLPPAGWFRLL